MVLMVFSVWFGGWDELRVKGKGYKGVRVKGNQCQSVWISGPNS